MYVPPASQHRRPQTGRPIPTRLNAAGRNGLIVVLALAAILLVWLLWPSSMRDVRNLGSRGTTVIAFGDSLTAGYGAGDGEDYPSRLAAMTGVAVTNAGVSGDTTQMALARLDRDVLSRDPRLVIVGLGGNDFLQSVPLSTTEENLRSIVRQVQGAGAMVMLLGFRFPSITASYEKMYARIAKEEGCLLVPDLLDGILSDASLRSDAIHPNAKGYAIVAERVAAPLRKLVASADRANQRGR